MINISVFCQILDIDIGLSIAPKLSDKSESFLNMGIGFTVKKFYGGFDMHMQFKTKGEYYKGWNQFPYDITESGIKYDVINFVGGYYNNNFLIAGIVGFCEGIPYHNCYDEYQILSDNGKWCETKGGWRNHENKINLA